MPTALVRRIDLDYLYPPFLERLLNLIADAKYQGQEYIAYFGFRSYALQKALHLAHQNGGPLAAPPGLSAHQYGMAVDMFYKRANGQASWDKSFFAPLKELCKKHKLAWGGDFKDWGHIGFPGLVSGKELTPLLATWNRLPAGTDLARLLELWKTVPENDQ